MLTLGYETTFDAAHYLPDYPGKCQRLHGHTWKVRVEIAGELQPNGMIADFRELRKLVDSVVNQLDHQHLNEFIGLPTAEHITLWLFDQLTNEMFRVGWTRIGLQSVTVWESEHSYCRLGD